jgi:DNA-binding Xre family transcriptional regulator
MIRVRLAELLLVRGLSLRELARRTDTHPDVLSRFGRQATHGVTYHLLHRICAELECSVADLLEYVPVEKQTELFD